MTIDEIKKHFKVRFDKNLTGILNLSTSTISKWRKQGIAMVWQESIQLRTNNQLIARAEDAPRAEAVQIITESVNEN